MSRNNTSQVPPPPPAPSSTGVWCYVMSGTGVAVWCYAMSGTGIAYGAISAYLARSFVLKSSVFPNACARHTLAQYRTSRSKP
eukprot:1953200-Rhodomonas_salina.1